MSVTQDAGQKRRNRMTALGFGLIALAFYLGFIAMSLFRGSH